MDSESIVLSIQDKLPKDLLATALKGKIDNLNDTQRSNLVANLPLLKLKSPTFVFWVGSFLLGAWGVGRFMAGRKLEGFLVLGLWLLYVILASIGSTIDNAILLKVAQTISYAVSGMWILGLITTGKHLRKKNLEKVDLLIDSIAGKTNGQ